MAASPQIALDIGREHRNASAGESLRHDLERHRLAGARRPGDEAVTIGEAQQQRFVAVPARAVKAAAQENRGIVHVMRHGGLSVWPSVFARSGTRAQGAACLAGGGRSISRANRWRRPWRS